MTTQADEQLLERIARFDKTPRMVEAATDITLITWDQRGQRWFIEEIEMGRPLGISMETFPILASRQEVERILHRIPPPMSFRDFTEPLRLVGQAQDIIAKLAAAVAEPTQEDVDTALWRLVDAAGLLSQLATPGATGTPGHPTGRGYSISG